MICLLNPSASAVNFTLDWAKTIGSPNSDDVKQMLRDSQGNILVFGLFFSTVDFDPGPGVYNLSSQGSLDVFVLKLDSNGQFIWAVSFGSTALDMFRGAAIDTNDNIILTGFYENNIDLDPSSGVQNFTSNGLGDLFIVKIGSTANYIWGKSLGNASNDVPTNLSIQSDQDIIITGYFEGTVDFDPGAGIYNATALGGDGFILSLDHQGQFNWVKTLEATPTSWVVGRSLTVDKDDQICLVGVLKGTVDMDPDVVSAYPLTSSSNSSLFILKLNPSGHFLWVDQLNSTNYIENTCIETDAMGNIYVAGDFDDSVDFDPGPADYTQVSNVSMAYILKLDTAGQFIWAKVFGGTTGFYPDNVKSLKVQNNGQVALCGEFSGIEDFDPGPGLYYLNPGTFNSSENSFAMGMDTAGNFQWAFCLFNTTQESAIDILKDPGGKYYITGRYNGLLDVDPTSANYSVQSNGGTDIFVIKLRTCTPSSSTDSIISCQPIQWVDGQVYSQSNYYAKDTFLNTQGCDSIVTLKFTLQPLDTSITQVYDTLISNATGVSYQWVDCTNNFLAVSGATGMNFHPATSGQYAVILDNGVCTDTSNCYSVTPTSVFNPEDERGFYIYPNPGHGVFYVHSYFSGECRLYDLLGKEVMGRVYSIVPGNNVIDLGAIPAGVYYFILRDAQGNTFRGKLCQN